MDSLRVGRLRESNDFDLRLTLLAGEKGLDRRIRHTRVQKHGLVLAGFFEHIHPERVQIFGNTELEFFASLPAERRREVCEGFFAQPVACVVCTKGLPVPPEMLEEAERHGVPLFSSSHLSSTIIIHLQDFLEEMLTASSSLHGVLLDVFGVGCLLLGKSGIGKSECALDLVMKGHRLVADDIVDIKRKKQDSVYGSGSEIIKHHMEIRGLGIINIKDLFGIAAVRDRKKIELVVELVDWDPHQEYDRLGIEEKTFTILDVPIPMLVVPVRPGRNMTTILEVAARNQLLKAQGHHSAREFQDRLNRHIAEGRQGRGLGDEIE